jgi:hypothetical protein
MVLMMFGVQAGTVEVTSKKTEQWSHPEVNNELKDDIGSRGNRVVLKPSKARIEVGLDEERTGRRADRSGKSKQNKGMLASDRGCQLVGAMKFKVTDGDWTAGPLKLPY